MSAGLRSTPEAAQRACKAVVSVVVRGGAREDRAKLGLGLVQASHREVGAAQRLPNTAPLRREAPGLLQTDTGLGGVPVAEEFRTGPEMIVDDFPVLLRQKRARFGRISGTPDHRTLGVAGAAETVNGMTSKHGAREGADEQSGGR